VDTMMALRAHSRGGPDQLVYEEVPKPVVGPGQVLVEVHAAGITFGELDWDQTWTRADGVDRAPVIPGHEVSGVVAALSEGCRLSVGDEVYGVVDFDRNGAAAQYVCVREESLALKPHKATHEQAAAMALSALTAFQALIDRTNLQPREQILITGASGGVGVYAVQIARSIGAQAVGSGGAAGRELAERLGVRRYFDYRDQPVDEALSGLDVVLDAAGRGDDEALYRVLHPGGRMILLSGPPDTDRANEHSVLASFFVVSADAAELDRLAAMVDRGDLEPIVGQTFPLAEGRAAYEGGNGPRPPGKTVLVVH
jgi:NADPH:quinone reductase-like Zn-dependent oxidoreductase